MDKINLNILCMGSPDQLSPSDEPLDEADLSVEKVTKPKKERKVVEIFNVSPSGYYIRYDDGATEKFGGAHNR